MLFKLLSNLTSSLCILLHDGEWEKTLGFINNYTPINVVETFSSTGTLDERIERFLRYKSSSHYKEEHKLAFLHGLLTKDALGRNVFFNLLEELADDWQPIRAEKNLRDTLNKLLSTGCFIGSYVNHSRALFINGLFDRDNHFKSAFHFLLEKHNHLLLKKMHDFFCILQLYKHSLGSLFLEKIQSGGNELFNKASKEVSSYEIISNALKRSNCSISQWNRFLNTSPSGSDLKIESDASKTPISLEETPAIKLILKKLNTINYKRCMSLLSLYHKDGMVLSEKQLVALKLHIIHLEKGSRLTEQQARTMEKKLKEVSVVYKPKNNKAEVNCSTFYPSLTSIPEETPMHKDEIRLNRQ